ncbi:extensin family protein [Aureimonas mangrovi]|uniref:extensin-like domain-containing protein n=1 Tax=Aureimonas mangrovi TaxID=2758041 RepID=UPI001FE2DF9A|nr:extensin family protein [Aureimonas mangrovi]
MVSRNQGWRIVTLAVAGFAAASALTGQPLAQNFSDTTGSVAPAGNLVWGGHVPPPPRPGEAPVYVPSQPHSSDYETVNQSSFRGVQPTPPQFLPPPIQEDVGVAPDVAMPAERGPGEYGRTYPVQQAPSMLPPPAPVQQAALPPLGPGQVIDDATPGSFHGALPDESFDPWEGLTDIDPAAAVPAPMPSSVPMPSAPVAPAARETPPSVPSYAALETVRPEPPAERGRSWNPFRWGRGSLEEKTPTGYRSLPRTEAMCRRELQRLGAQFTEANTINGSGSCGIQTPIRVTQAAKGIAMQPAATLSCQTALQTARWLDDEVRSAARWTLFKRPTAIINASSYRCSRIAGSRTISEHALGNALDIRGFRFSDGSTVLVEPKGMFSPRERSFQQKVRVAGCKYFGTVLGPGYNKAHDDHFHFDVKSRMRPVCK